MEPRTRLLNRWVERGVSSNRILLYLAGTTLALSTAAGFVMHWIDEEAFPTVGTGIWWAVVTFCTVGYGDYVPQGALGRFVGGVVMVFAITFITVITALVTSALVTGEERRRARGACRAPADPRGAGQDRAATREDRESVHRAPRAQARRLTFCSRAGRCTTGG